MQILVKKTKPHPHRKMKVNLLVVILLHILVIVQAVRIKGIVKKRTPPPRKKNTNGSKCILNETITNDYEILSSTVSESRYIFTARVLSVKRIKRGKKPNVKVYMVYRLYVWLVMKGDVVEMRDHVYLGNERTLNGAIVTVEWLRTNRCAYKLYRHSSGIFLSDGFYREHLSENLAQLRLLSEPLPLTLYDLDRVNAALQGRFLCTANYENFMRLCCVCLLYAMKSRPGIETSRIRVIKISQFNRIVTCLQGVGVLLLAYARGTNVNVILNKFWGSLFCTSLYTL